MFSTRNGKYAQRPALPNMSIVIRSDPREDRDSMTAKLQTEFPAICRAIRTFGTIVGDYFDGYDQELQGFEFLRAVVMHIAAINENRAGRVLGYVEAWMASNQEAFAEVTPGHTLERLFKQEDIDKYGGDFMEDAAAQIKHRKIHALRSGKNLYLIQCAGLTPASGVAQESQRLQQQQQEPMGMELLLSRSHYGPSPSSLPASQNPRGMSKPERSQSNVQQNPAPSVPPDPSHRQRGVYSLYPLGPEHFQTGSFNPITVPPDPAHFAMSNYHSPRMSHNNTASSRGFPGSLGYGPQPRAVLSHRHQNYNDNQPKGRKNPVKRSSDDARRGSFEAGSRRQSSGRRRSSQLGTFDLVQSPQSMRSSVQSFNDPSQPPFYPYAYQIEPATDVQYQPPMTAYDLANMQNAVPYPPGNDRRQSSTSAPINPIASYARNRSATEPEHLIPQNSLPTTMTHSPDPVYLGPRLSGTGDQQTLTTRAPVASGQSPELAGQSRDSHVFEYQISNVQSSLSPTQPMAADIDTHPKPSVKNENQHQAQPAQRSRHQESPKKDADPIKSVSIWIGRIPREYSKSTVLEILEPCRGLLKIGEPRVSANHYFESPDAYVFAV